jgi:predicted dehydrogenase
VGRVVSDLRVGVVGLGIGRQHLRSWVDVEGASVVIVADVDIERRERAAQRWSIAAVDSLDAMLAAGVDIVDLCTPPAIHEAQIEQCLAVGVHVICEKPLVDSVEACDRLRVLQDRALAASGARLMPVLQYRFGDGAFQARALVEAGLTGRLYTASASTWWRRGRDYYDSAPWRGTWDGERGGSVLTHSIHIHDLLTWIGGPLRDVRALTATRVNEIETEDCAVAIGRTVDGGLVSMNVNLGAVTESSRLVWCFEHVQIESSTSPYDPGAGPWTFEFTDPAVQAEAERVFDHLDPTKSLFSGQFQGFVDALVEGGSLPVELDDAQASLELVTAWYRSARTGSTEALPLTHDHPNRGSWRPPGFT